MKKRKKIPFQTVADLGYYKFAKGKSGGVSGYFYWLANKLTDKQKGELKEYGNVQFLVSQCQYAPEIKHDVLFVGDKCFG